MSIQTPDPEVTIDDVMAELDKLPAYHPIAVMLANGNPDAYREWCIEVENGQRVWQAASDVGPGWKWVAR